MGLRRRAVFLVALTLAVHARSALAASDDAIVERSAAGLNELVYAGHGALTAAAPGQSSETVVRGYLAANAARHGLQPTDLDSIVVLGDSPGGSSGLRMVRVEQRVHGLPVFPSEVRFVLDRQGALWRVLGTLIPGVAGTPPPARGQLQSPQTAAASLLSNANKDVVQAAATGPDRFELSGAGIAGIGSARLVWFAPGTAPLIPAWSLILPTTGAEDWYALVDARSGAVLWQRNLRESLSTHGARFGVHVQADGVTPADSPAPQSPNTAIPGSGSQYPRIARTPVSMLAAQNLSASPNGWIDDCPGGGDGCDTTRGNNVDACIDRDATPNVCDATLDVTGRPRGNPDGAARNRDFLGGAPRDFEYAAPPEAANPDLGDVPTNPDYQRGAVAQAFYIVNWFHDRMFALGFDEPSGNFQQVNLQGLGGLGGDRIAADVQNGGSNSGNFAATPDGQGVGRLQLFLWDGPKPDRDTALDAEFVIHELAHGLSHRLVGNAAGLLWDPARSLGEGWSDFYALSLLNGTASDDPNGRYAFGGYSFYQRLALGADNYFYGARRFPYSTDNAINPLTWADVDAVTANDGDGMFVPSPLALSPAGALEVHNAGSVWALSLWEVRARVIADPAGAGGNVAIGNETMLQLVTDALKLTPANPSFIDARDALIVADCATNGCANERSIWAGFADRGLGYRAVAPFSVGGRFARGHVAIGTSFETPHLSVSPETVVIDDFATGNGDARLDPGETVALAIPLGNPWRGTAAQGISATLSTSTAGVSIIQGSASYPNISAHGNAGPVGAPLRIALAGDVACGARIHFSLATQSSLGNRTAQFSLRVGTRAGLGAPLAFTRVANLPIPDFVADGVTSTLTINDDHEIGDLDLRVDSLTHAVTGQLTLMLRAPNGLGSDLIWRRGGLLTPNQGVGANFVNLTIDDDLPLTAAEDLNQSLASQAPFTGDWLPAFNSPFWDSYATAPPVTRDPIPQLQRLDGTSSAGVWQLNVADGNNTSTGTLDSWSLLIRPRLYSCTPPIVSQVFKDGFEGG